VELWKLYKWNGNYIMGDLISSHSSEAAALKRAEKEIDFKYSEREKRKKEIIIWLDDNNYTPVGIIVHKLKGVKRFRQSKKKE